jgi:hypothetical protein
MHAAPVQLGRCLFAYCLPTERAAAAAAAGGGVLPSPVRKQDRTSSADLSSLADYHLRINSINARQAAAAAALAASIAAEQNSASSGSDGRLRDALTARIVPKASSAAVPVAVGARGSSELLVASSAVAASANRLGRRRLGAQLERSMIAPIMECEEGSHGTPAGGSVDGSSASLEREKALSAEALRKHIAATSADSFLGSGTSSRQAPGSAASNSSSPPRVRPPSQRQPSGSSELPESFLAEESRHEQNASTLLHGHLPQWMWPFAKEDAAAKEVTTDELMRQIGASGNDAAKLQQACCVRGTSGASKLLRCGDVRSATFWLMMYRGSRSMSSSRVQHHWLLLLPAGYVSQKGSSAHAVHRGRTDRSVVRSCLYAIAKWLVFSHFFSHTYYLCAYLP